MISLELVSLGLLTTACITASWYDVYSRRIPNWLCAVTAVTGLTAATLVGGLPALGGNFAHLVLALLAGMVLFKLGGFGGGDAKFYAAVAGWFALADGATLLMLVAFCGLVLLVVWFTIRRAAGKPVRRTSDDPYDGLPYGVAIGAAAILAKLILQ